MEKGLCNLGSGEVKSFEMSFATGEVYQKGRKTEVGIIFCCEKCLCFPLNFFFSKSENCSNLVFFGGRETKSKNFLQLLQKHQKTVPFHERTSIKADSCKGD